MNDLASLVQAADALLMPEPDELCDERVMQDFLSARRVKEKMAVIELSLLPQIERRKLHSWDGHLSTEAWLSSSQNDSFGSARAQVKTARALEQMPVAREALKSGDISTSQAMMLARAQETSPEAFEASEQTLVTAAKAQPVATLGKTIGYWNQKVQLQECTEQSIAKRRCLDTSVISGGMVRIGGDLDPETGEMLRSALASILDQESKSGTQEEDSRTWPQRRHDALSEILRQRAGGPGSSGRPDRPLITVTVDARVLAAQAARDGLALSTHLEGQLAELNGRAVGNVEAALKGHSGSQAPAPAGGRSQLCEIDHVGPISPETALRLSCDASVMRVVLSGASQPLDVGRRTSVVPSAMRRAVIVRDRHCRFPRCDYPPSWCDAHHVVHWAQGGSTSMDNLLLLCRRHHGMTHAKSGFRLQMEQGQPVFRRPDGSRLDGRGPP